MTDELQRSLGRVEGKLDSLLDAFKSAQDHSNARFDKHDRRLTAVERKSWYQGGVFAVIAAIGTYIFNRHS